MSDMTTYDVVYALSHQYTGGGTVLTDKQIERIFGGIVVRDTPSDFVANYFSKIHTSLLK